MPEKRKNPVRTFRNQISKRLISHQITTAVLAKRDRNKVITYDFILEENTSPQDEYELFQYLCSRKDSCFDAYYIINEKSAAYPEIKARYGDRIIPYSREKREVFLRHFIELLKTTKFICGGFQVLHALGAGITEAVKRSPYVYSFFTQHGVNFFKDNFISQSAYSSFLFDKIMISNEFEKKLFMDRGCYREDQLVPNGLFRWDLLSSENAQSEKSIFIYFTHRRYLRNIENVQDSVYVRTIAGFLKDPRFNKLVKEHGYTVKIALHHTVLSVCGENILEGFHILEDAEIADAKKNSAILITDYSSMCFEMWFQHKPVIFLNVPDAEDCIQYGHKTDLPAPYAGKEDYIYNVVNSTDECVDLLEGYFRSNFKFSEDEKKKRDKFFYYNSDFCKRFYEYLAATKEDTKTLFQMPLNEHILFSRHSDLYTRGVDFPDSVGRWIVRKKAKLGFYVPSANQDLVIRMNVLPNVRDEIGMLEVTFSINGHMLKTEVFYEREQQEVVLEIPLRYLPDDRYAELSFCAGKGYQKRGGKPMMLKLCSMAVLEKNGENA